MRTPFRIALELAWSDGSMSKDGALMLEEFSDAIGLDAENRQKVENEFNEVVLADRTDRGAGSGAVDLREWLDIVLEELKSTDIGCHLSDVAWSAVEAGLTKLHWLGGLQYSSELGLQDVFERAVWAEDERCDTNDELPEILKPLSEFLQETS